MIKQQAEPKSPHPPFAKGGQGAINSETGFTLMELLITMVIFVLVIAAGSQIFTGMLTQFKQQSKISETNIEGIVGLEILRQDIGHSGYGLPWVMPSGITYAAAETFSANPCGTGTTADPTTFNDSSSNAPKAIISGNNTCLNSSDYLVIKAVNVATNNIANRWALLGNSGVLRSDISGDAFATSDRVIVLDPGTSDATMRTLVGSGSTFFKQYNVVTDFEPSDSTTTRFIYGINGANPKVPFNRADYYISATNPPQRCAIGTGVLYKATINHGSVSGTNQFTELPLLDCVADMQVIYGIDTDATMDGAVNCYVNDPADALATVDAENIRNRIKEVRVYLLAHEGQYDRSFAYNPPISPSSIRVGEPSSSLPGGSCSGVAVLGQDFDLSGITNWQNYRWKVYTLVVKPNNLR
jgi:prepilin-type N-terminal cleavage/methylation domain-containing protein